jgi:hypothetical protein
MRRDWTDDTPSKSFKRGCLKVLKQLKKNLDCKIEHVYIGQSRLMGDSFEIGLKYEPGKQLPVVDRVTFCPEFYWDASSVRTYIIDYLGFHAEVDNIEPAGGLNICDFSSKNGFLISEKTRKSFTKGAMRVALSNPIPLDEYKKTAHDFIKKHRRKKIYAHVASYLFDGHGILIDGFIAW